MPNPDFNDLFHDSGVQGILDFLLSKLEVDDLSPDEALAMLSAVHEELEEGISKDPKTFNSYKDFMVFLQREKPEIYNYVISAWNRGNEKLPAENDNWDSNFEDPRNSSIRIPGVDVASVKGSDEVRVINGIPNEESEIQEPGEIEEKDSTAMEKTVELVKEPYQEESLEEQEEPEEEEIAQKENNAEESVELTDYNAEEPEDEARPLENDDEGAEEINVEIESDEKEPEPTEVPEQNEGSDEPSENTEKSELESDSEIKAEETEWPVIEQPMPEEPLEDGEEEEGSPGAED